MKIAVIGAGSVGSTLGKAWQRRGHEVGYGTRNPDDEKYASLGARVATNDQAAADADVVALCTPWQATREAVQSCGDLAGKVLIDCTNPLKPDVSGLEVGGPIVTLAISNNGGRSGSSGGCATHTSGLAVWFN